MKYIVIGATGNTGRIVASELLKVEKSVRAVGRNADKLAPLGKSGAETIVADVQNPDDMKRAFESIDAAYVMIPPNFAASNFRKYQDEVTDNITDAMAANGTKFVVSLSSVGADQPSGVGPVNGLHYMERQFDGIPDLNTLHIRAGFFMENLLGSLSMIKNMGIYGSASPGEAPWPLIATSDIGLYSAQRLIALNFEGKNVQYLLGPHDVSGNETAAILGKVLGIKKLPYVSFSMSDMKKGLLSAGMPEQIADNFCELFEGFDNGLMAYHRDAGSTTKTNLEEFAKRALKPVFDAM